MGQPRPLFVYFRSFQTIHRIKTVDFSGIQTRIDRAKGKNADHLTTTTAQFCLSIKNSIMMKSFY